jgi:hypothetical protein
VIVFDNVSNGRDRQLMEAVTRFGIIEFLVRIAKGQSPGGISEARLEELWGQRINRDYIKGAFRSASPGMHEWIPTNYIPNVLARASDAVEGQETLETAALWVRVHHAWRSETTNLIFTPEFSSRTENGATVLQGHSGAVYIGRTQGRPSPQTYKQGDWHNRLRDIFDTTSFRADSVSTVQALLQRVQYYVGETIWTGSGAQTSAVYENYKTASGEVQTFAALRTVASQSHSRIASDFDRVVGLLR